MRDDIKMMLVAAIGLGFFAWALQYHSQFADLVGSTTQGYGNVVKALQPSGMGGAPGFTSNIPGQSGFSALSGG